MASLLSQPQGLNLLQEVMEARQKSSPTKVGCQSAGMVAHLSAASRNQADMAGTMNAALLSMLGLPCKYGNVCSIIINWAKQVFKSALFALDRRSQFLSQVGQACIQYRVYYSCRGAIPELARLDSSATSWARLVKNEFQMQESG